MQTNGLVCIVCERDDIRALGCSWVSAGRSVKGSGVFACVGGCTEATEANSVIGGIARVVVAGEYRRSDTAPVNTDKSG